MKLVRYNQSGADFYGAEGEIYFKPTPRYRIGLFRRLRQRSSENLPSLPGREDAYGNRPLIAQADQNAPRVPAARLGFHLNAALTDRIDAHLDYYRVFAQNKLARYETRTPGHHMLNLGANYRRRTGYGEWIGMSKQTTCSTNPFTPTAASCPTPRKWDAASPAA